MKAHLFRFKQFAIVQEKSAMKIGTDGVLLGAWATQNNPQQILDIGAGTGLITLMLAQRFPKAKIIGIEIDQEAAIEAQSNLRNSPFHDRCEIIQTPFQLYTPEIKFDLIVSNPPFFEISLSEVSNRSIARQQLQLTFEELIQNSEKHLTENGTCAYIIPYNAHQKLIEIAEQFQLFPSEVLHVKGNEKAPLKRSLIAFTRNKSDCKIDELIIEKERHIYTDSYIDLTKDFYLKM